MRCAALPVLLFLLGPVLAQAGPPARLEGMVTNALRRPLANARVTVEVDGEVVARTHSDATGFFVVGVLPQRQALVRAVAGPDVGAVELDLAGIEQGFAWVPVYQARTLRGRVARPDGSPVAGAWILAAPTDRPETAVIHAQTRSDEQGHYTLTHVLAGPVRVRAWAEGHEAWESEFDGSDDVDCDVELDPDPWREVTVVLRDASPEQCTQTRLVLAAQGGPADVFVPLPPPLRRLRPAADGTCQVRGWPARDRLLVRPEIPGCEVQPAWDFVPRGPRRWRTTFDVAATPGVVGVVRDEAGRAMPGVALFVRPLDCPGAILASYFACTDAGGEFRLPAPVAAGERFALRVVAPDLAVTGGHLGTAARSWHVAQHAPDTRHEVVVGRFDGIRLRVVDRAGSPVRGAQVRIRILAPVGPSIGEGVSDADGCILVQGVNLSGELAVWLSITALDGVLLTVTGVEDRGGLDLGTLELYPAARVAGVVRDADGRAVTGARVVLRNSQERGQQVGLTDRAGRYTFGGLMPGRYGCGADRGDGTAGVEGWIDVALGEIAALDLVVQ